MDTQTTTTTDAATPRLAPKPNSKARKAEARKAKAKATGTVPPKAKAEPKAEKLPVDKAALAEVREEAHKRLLALAPLTVPCGCGCKEAVPARRFRPGHDAKLFSRLLAEVREERGL